MNERSNAGELARRIAREGCDPEAVLECLEVAAALGPDISIGEWLAAGRQLGLDCDEELVDALVREGVAESGERAWTFVDADLVDGLARSSTRHGRWKRHSAACAQAIYDFHPVQSPAIAARRVVHLLEAGKTEEALEPLLLAEQYHYDRGLYDRAEAMLDEYEGILDAKGIASDDEQRGRSLWRRGRLLFSQGSLERAISYSEMAEDLLEDSQYTSERGQAALFAGRILRDAGEIDRARQKLKVAVESFAAGGDDRGLALSRAGLGMLLLTEGEARAALEAFSKAKIAFEEHKSPHLVASVLTFMAQAWHYLGDRLRAMTCIEQARDVAQAHDDVVNEAATWNFEGEIARDNRDWGYAKRCYRRAARLYEEIGSTSEHIARFNNALVEIGAGAYESAGQILSQVESEYRNVGFGARLPLVYAAHIVVMAALDDLAGLDRYLTRLENALADSQVAHPDILEQLERAESVLDSTEHHEAREQVESLADEQRAALDG